MSRHFAVALLIAASLFLCAAPQSAFATTLVGDVFTTPNSGWVDAFPPPTREGNWRYSLHNPTLMDTNNANPPTSGGGTNTGLYQPDVLVQNNFVTPSTYELSSTMRTNDDDIIGLVWNYVDPNNYYRVGIRSQYNAFPTPPSGTFGGTAGLAIQKVVGGVVTQINPNGTGEGAPSPIAQGMIDARTAFNLKVAVDGATGGYQVLFDGNPIVSGTDAGLVNSGGKIGLLSWAQQSDAAAVTPFWGSEFETVSVSDTSGTLFSQTLASPTQWRNVLMKNTDNVTGTTGTTSRETLGNFGLSADNNWVYQHSNGNLNATATKPNIDFIGPSVAFDGPGAASMTDYEMRVRLGASDNDGFGVLVRVLDDNNFYRINFTTEEPGASLLRPPLGLSVQKVRNGVWDQLAVDSTYAPAVGNTTTPTTPATGLPMHDLIVRAVGNTLKIRLTDNLGVLHDYALITDGSDPILAGSVGFATWGSNHDYYMGYGGVPGPLVVEIPEPASVCLALLAAVGMCLVQRQRLN